MTYLGEPVPEEGELLVVRPEVVAPLRNTVRLVDNEPLQQILVVHRHQGVLKEDIN